MVITQTCPISTCAWPHIIRSTLISHFVYYYFIDLSCSAERNVIPVSVLARICGPECTLVYLCHAPSLPHPLFRTTLGFYVGQKLIIMYACIYFWCSCCRPEITMVIMLILNSPLLHFCNTLLAKTVQKMREPTWKHKESITTHHKPHCTNSAHTAASSTNSSCSQLLENHEHARSKTGLVKFYWV